MMRYEDSLRCDGCGIEIRWRPVRVGKFIFCCNDCLKGIRCECEDRLELEDDRREGRISSSPGMIFGEFTR